MVTTITYTPNRTVGRPPANVSLKLTGLSSGSHTFKVKVSYHETVKRTATGRPSRCPRR